jgi:hypothetical protein
MFTVSLRFPMNLRDDETECVKVCAKCARPYAKAPPERSATQQLDKRLRTEAAACLKRFGRTNKGTKALHQIQSWDIEGRPPSLAFP